MTTQERRNQKNPQKQLRQFQGEERAIGVVNWLNTTQDSKGRDRITEILSTFHQVMTLVRDVQQLEYKDAEGWYRWSPRVRVLTRKLDALMRYYTVAPKVFFVPPSSDSSHTVVGTGWQPVPGSELAHHLANVPRDRVGDNSTRNVGRPILERTEAIAILEIHDFMRSGLIFKIHQCRCGKFFFQKFKTQRFCSEKCRIAEFRDSDEARLKRNAYARDLYHAKKDLEEGKRR